MHSALEEGSRRHARIRESERSRIFGETFRDPATGEIRSYASLMPRVWTAQKRVELELPQYAKRAWIRNALADTIERQALPLTPIEWIRAIPQRLRTARKSGCLGLEISSGKPVVFWDLKAGMSKLCPDDAREEGQRLRRRLQKPLEDLQAGGARLTFAVLTTPNVKPGELAGEMRAIFKRFRELLPKIPQIEGALGVLEAPLGEKRDWNVHLNAILVTRGFVDWAKVRKLWGFNVELRLLPAEQGAIASALAEAIKYPVESCAEKSVHAERTRRDGRVAYVPPMIEWTGPELLEWLQAMHGFRRTRTYGELYGLKDPEKAELGPVAWIGAVSLYRGRYALRCRLLESIPEDKSAPDDRRIAWERFVKRYRPPDPELLEVLDGLPRVQLEV